MVSKDSLLLKVAGRLNAERIQRGDIVVVEHERMGKGGEVGPGRFSRKYIRSGSGGSGFEFGGLGGVRVGSEEEA